MKNPSLVHTVIVTGLLATWIPAQLGVSPHKDFASQEGGSHSSEFGSYQRGIFQLADGSMRNAGRPLREVAFRPDGQVGHGKFTGMGRSWANVWMRISDCNVALMSNLYNRNIIGRPVGVFNGRMTWPTLTDRSATTPARFEIKFPFNQVWQYTGTNDILLHFDFTGGTLANSDPWTSNRLTKYYLDTYNYGTFARDVGSRLGDYGPFGGCVDTRARNSNGADTRVTYKTYGPNFSNAAFQNKHQVSTQLVDAGPGAMAVQLIGVAKRSGATFPGVSCQKIWLDLNMPYLLSTIRVGTFGNTGLNYWGLSTGLFPRNPAIEGATFGVQSAWADTGTGSLNLSACRWTHVPRLPKWTDSNLVPRRAVWEINAVGFGPTYNNSHNPIIRYR